jgi:translocation and assembly module TamB
MRIEELDLGELSVRVGARAPLQFSKASLSYQGGRTVHEIEHLDVITPWGPVSGWLRLGARRDFPVEGTLAMTLAGLPVDGKLAAKLAGSLTRIETAVSGTIMAHAIDARGQLRLFESQIFDAVGVHWQSVDLAKLFDGAPRTALDVVASASPSPDAWLAGTLEVRNASAGLLSAGRLPVAAATAGFHWTGASLSLTELDADLGPAGEARGDVQVSSSGATLKLDVRRFNLDGLHEALAVTALDGRVDANLAGAVQSASASLSQRGLSLNFDASRRGAEIEITDFMARQGGGSLAGQGRMDLEGRRTFNADLRFDGIEPSAFLDLPVARLTGTTRIEGSLAPAWNVQGRFALRNSRLRGLPLSGNGAVTANAHRVTARGIELRLGGNSLWADGAYGAAGDAMALRVEAPALAEIDPRLAGRLNAQGSISGTVRRPAIEMTFAGDGLSVTSYTAAVIDGRGSLAYGDDPALHLVISGEKIVVPLLGEMAAGQLEIDGRRSDHTAKAGATGNLVELSAEARGSLTGARWSGHLTALENYGRYPMRLEAPVAVTVAPGELDVGVAHIVGGDGKVSIERIQFGNGRLDSAGEFSGAPAAFILARAGVDPARSTLRLRGAWQVATTPRINGTFRVERDSGDLAFGEGAPIPMRLSEFFIEGDIVEDVLTLAGNAAGGELGEVSLAATVLPVAGARPPALGASSPLEARLGLSLPNLRAFNRFFDGNLNIDGNANAAIAVEGTVSDPVVTGKFAARGVRVAAPQEGVFLTDGRLEGELGEREIRISELSLAGGTGRVSATGRLGFGDADAESTIEWRAEDFRLFSSPSRRLVLDGSGSLDLRDRRLQARGDLRASQGLFVLTPTGGPRLGDDVVVVGRERPVASRRTPLPLDVDASFDFGSGFRIQQQGLDATLSGRLRLQTDATGQLLAEGTINVDRGTYLAYGQTLSIDNGRLHFSGPANNPGLDITALRRNLPVQAGVRITGTARTPLVQLVSEPPMPDNEKLSWLILGRSVSTTSTADAAMLASAAEALLAGPSGIPFTTRVARQFGFDEFGLRSRGDEGDAVALGRQLSDRVYLFLERGIGAATTILVAEFTLTRELRLRAEAGDVNGLGITWRRMLE